jgi:cyanophycin synthetase
VLNLTSRSRTPLQPSTTHETFAAWRRHTISSGLAPVIGVSGSRGKTTVIRLLNTILENAGLRTAIRTNFSVETRGERQRGEIAPWSRALDDLKSGSLDIGIEELDWLTIHSMGLERATFPAFAITNVCANRDACLVQGDTKRAIASLPIIFESVHEDGFLVINGDDFDVSRQELEHRRASIFVGLNKESPGLRDHLSRGGKAAYSNTGMLVVGDGESSREIVAASELQFALFGHAGFQIQNALMAAAIASSIGLKTDEIRLALRQFNTSDFWMPDSFRVVDLDGIAVVLDRPNPSWFLRSVLRSLRDIAPNRIISVVGRLTGVPVSDLPEVGRLIGRASSLVVAHSENDEPARAAAIKQGAAQNEVPAVIMHTRSEGRALSKALSLARKGDLILVLADRPVPLIQSIKRAAESSARARLASA